MTKLTVLAVMIVATVSLMVSVSTIIEQDVKAQNITTNMTNSTGSEDSSSESIASRGAGLHDDPYDQQPDDPGGYPGG